MIHKDFVWNLCHWLSSFATLKSFGCIHKRYDDESRVVCPVRRVCLHQQIQFQQVIGVTTRDTSCFSHTHAAHLSVGVLRSDRQFTRLAAAAAACRRVVVLQTLILIQLFSVVATAVYFSGIPCGPQRCSLNPLTRCECSLRN